MEEPVAASWQPGASPRTLGVEAPVGWAYSSLANMHAVVALAFLFIDASSELEFVDAKAVDGALLMADAVDGDGNAGACCSSSLLCWNSLLCRLLAGLRSMLLS